MDRAILLSPTLISRRGTPELIKGATVYLGDEFCIHKQASFRDFAAVRKLSGKNPVLLSTLLTEPAFERYALLLAECAKKAPGTEVVVNDVGLLRFIDQNYRGRFRLSLGRLMTYFFDTKHTRLPGCTRPLIWTGETSAPAARKADREAEERKRKSWEDGLDLTPIAYIREFLKRYAIERVETDSEYLFKKYAENTDMKISFYYPLRLMATTRFCPFVGGIVPSCKAPCGTRLVRLETRELDYRLFSKGNAYFAKNKIFRHPRLDRLVVMPLTKSPCFNPLPNKYSNPDRPSA